MTTENAQMVPAPLGPVERVVGRPVPKRPKLPARQRRMKAAIAYMQKYMAGYDKQLGCLDYSDATLIDDVLYGLGVALHGTSCSYANGYEAWKEKLREHLKTPNAGSNGPSGVAAKVRVD